jgi:hypothetical protein
VLDKAECPVMVVEPSLARPVRLAQPTEEPTPILAD